jgi:serine/threonine-protein kinase
MNETSKSEEQEQAESKGIVSKPSAPPPPIDRSRIGRFEVIYPLAQGGMASVHVGRLSGMAGFEKLVAIKVIHSHLASEESFVKMFLDEARLAAQIHHPNVGEVIEVGEDHGLFYMVCELILGQSLRRVFLRARDLGMVIPRPMSADIAAKVCAALHDAHELYDADGQPYGLVHRDVSPRNVLISYNGFVKLIDFGIAWAQGRMSHTDAGVVKGKMGFMPPEQIDGQTLDRRSDIFSLGVMLYLMVTGKHPFSGESDGERMRKILDGNVLPPSEVAGDVDPALEAVIMRAVARSPDDRFPDAAEMGRELKAYVHRVAEPPGSWDSAAELGRLMRGLFSAELDGHRQQIRAVERESGADASFEMPDLTPSGSAAEPLRPSETDMTSADTPSSLGVRTGDRRSRAVKLGIAGGAVLIAALVVFLVVGFGAGDGEREGPALSEDETALSGVPIAEQPTFESGRGDAGTTEGEPARIRVVFDVRPAEAVISVDGERLEAGAKELELIADGEVHDVVLEAEGYQTVRDSFVADLNQKFSRRLEELHEKKPGGKRKGGKKKKGLGLMDSPY